MLQVRKLISAAALAFSLALPASAESDRGTINLGSYVVETSAFTTPQRYSVGPVSQIGIRGGIMFLPQGAGVLAADLTFSKWNLGDGWTPRFDVDAFINSDFDGDDTAVSVTANAVKFIPNAIGSRNIYVGGGVGWMFGGEGDGSFQAKLILGTPITNQFSAELNTHFIEGTVAWTVLARLHL